MSLQIKTCSNRHVTLATIEAVRNELPVRLEEVTKMGGHGRGTGHGTSPAEPPKFDETASWPVFRRESGTIAEHKLDAPR